jgi:hypothetical protein
MVTVPTYQRDVSTRPIFQQDLAAQATPQAFGADIGRGMQSLARGMDQASIALAQVQDIENTMRAKDSLTAFEREKMELDYGKNGYLTTQGRNAVEGRDAYNAALEDLRKRHGAALPPAAARKYDEASTSAVTQGMRSGLMHAAQGTKDWAASSSVARMEILKDQALAGYDRPDEIQKSLTLGFAEIDAQAGLMGWDKDVVDLKRLEFSSQVHSNIAIALASKPNGARSAMAYLKEKSAGIDTKTRMDIETKLRPFAVDEEAASVVDGIVSKGRKVSDLPGDIVGEVAGVTDGGGGPRRSKAFLSSRSAHKDRPGDTLNLDDGFADNLAALMQDAPPDIRDGLGIGSGYRSNERQKELFENSDKTGKMVAFPAGYTKPDGTIAKGSNHLHGRAADLTYNGQRLDKAPKHVRDWVHENADKYGLRFPMSWEAWHIEPASPSGKVVPAYDGPSARSTMPSYSDAMDQINAIADPEVRTAAMKRLTAQFEIRSKAQNANADQAKTEIWTMMMQGQPLSSVPLELKIAAGREAVSGFMDFEDKSGQITTDPVAYSNLTTMAASYPDVFAKIDLTAPEVINSLSREDWKSISDKKSSVLNDQRKAREDGVNLTTAFSQASSQLEAVGLTTAGKDGSEREETARRIAQFQNMLAQQMEEFKKASGTAPNQMEIQGMVNKLLLPVVIRTEKSIWNPTKTPWSAFNENEGLAFELGGIGPMADGTVVEPSVKYKEIPPRDRIEIEVALEAQLRRKPSEAEVEGAYRRFLAEAK